MAELDEKTKRDSAYYKMRFIAHDASGVAPSMWDGIELRVMNIDKLVTRLMLRLKEKKIDGSGRT